MFPREHRTVRRLPTIVAATLGLLVATALIAAPALAQVPPPEPVIPTGAHQVSTSPVPNLAAANQTDANGVDAAVSALHQLQAHFHQSISGGGNIDDLMSLWTDDATFTAGDVTYRGKDDIRAFFLRSPGFTHNWVSLSPLFKTRFHVRGKTADIYFECHFVDWQADPEIVVTHTSLAGMAKKVHGQWLFWHVTATPITLTP